MQLVVRAQTVAPTREMIKTILQTSPSTEVTREPNQMISWQDQGPTHLQSSLIPTRPDYRGRRVTARVWSQLFQMLAFLPPTVTANSRRCASVQPNLINISSWRMSPWISNNPKERGGVALDNLYNHLPTVCIFFHCVHLYSIIDTLLQIYITKYNHSTSSSVSLLNVAYLLCSFVRVMTQGEWDSLPSGLLDQGVVDNSRSVCQPALLHCM